MFKILGAEVCHLLIKPFVTCAARSCSALERDWNGKQDEEREALGSDATISYWNAEILEIKICVFFYYIKN